MSPLLQIAASGFTPDRRGPLEEHWISNLISNVNFMGNGFLNKVSVTSTGDSYGAIICDNEKFSIAIPSPNGVLYRQKNNGDVDWARGILAGPTKSRVFPDHIGIDSSNNLYVLLYVNELNKNSSISLIKYSSSGIKQWERVIQDDNGIFNAFGFSVDSAGNSHIYTEVFDVASAKTRPSIIKYNTSGVLQWQRSLSLTNFSLYAESMAIDASSNVYVTVYASDDATGTVIDEYIVKYNSAGTIQWQRRLRPVSPFTYVGYSKIAVDSLGDVYFVMTMYNQSTIRDGIAVIKYNTAGTFQWETRLIESSIPNGAINLNFAAYDAGSTTGNFIFILGNDVDFSNSSRNSAFIIRLGPTGAISYSRRFVANSGAWETNFASISTNQSLTNFYLHGGALNDLLNPNSFSIFKLPANGSKTRTSYPFDNSGEILDYRTANYNTATVTQVALSSNTLTGSTLSSPIHSAGDTTDYAGYPLEVKKTHF